MYLVKKNKYKYIIDFVSEKKILKLILSLWKN